MAVAALLFVKEPEGTRESGVAVKELAGPGQPCSPPDPPVRARRISLRRSVGAHAAVGEHEAGHARGAPVVDEVLHPGEVWRCPSGGTP